MISTCVVPVAPVRRASLACRARALAAEGPRSCATGAFPAVGASAQPGALPVSGDHRSCYDTECGYVGRDSRHHLGGNSFVASTGQHDGIHRLGANHFFSFHRKQIAKEHGGGRAENFVERDRRECKRQPSGLEDTPLDGRDQLGHIAVARVVVARRVNDTNNGSLEVGAVN